jgi:hypothetical protein
MASRPGLAGFVFALAALTFVGPRLAAQIGDASQSGAAAPIESEDYKLGRDAAGNPIFTQCIRWQSAPGALEYELRLRAEDGDELPDERLREPKKEVRLAAGRYEYKVTTYNLLGKAEAETDWIELEVIRAEQPVLHASSPRTIYLETLDRRVTMSGSKLLAEGRPILVAKDGALHRGRIVQQANDFEIVAVFPDDAYIPGECSLGFENPGGLTARLENSLVLRAPSIMPEFWISGSGAASFGLGAFADWTRTAFGGGFGFEIDRILFKRLSLGLDVDYLEYLPATSEIFSLRQLGLVFSVGYRIAINPRWAVIPRLGLGYGEGFVSDIMGELRGGQLFLAARGEGSWLFLPQWRMNAAAGYRATIEKSAWFSALSLGMSLSWLIPVEVERSWIIR